MCVFVFFATRPCIQVNNSGHSLSQCLQIIMAFMTLVCTHISISIYICCTLSLALSLSLSGSACVSASAGVYFRVACCFGEFCSSSFYLRRSHTYSRAQPTKVHLDFYVVLVSFAALSGNAKKHAALNRKQQQQQQQQEKEN